MDEALDRRTIAYVVLTSLFVASLTASNYLASKVFLLGTLKGITLAAPAAVAAYALTFTFTDIISEVYGKKAANLAVRLGFATQILVLAYTLIALHLETAPFSPVSQEEFKAVVGSQSSIITASLIAYLVSQHHDVWAFHWWREKTRGRWLWLRNNASTLVSQALDTIIFITLAFAVLPHIFGGRPLPMNLVLSIIAGQYLVKALIALLDTPLVYAGVLLTRAYIGVQEVLERAAPSFDTTLRNS